MSSKNKTSYSIINCKRCGIKLCDFNFCMQYDEEKQYYGENNTTTTLNIENIKNTNIIKNKLFCIRCGKLLGTKIENKSNVYKLIRKNIKEIDIFARVFDEND